ncbi:MAG: bifunctional nuclease family protein [Saprospiraceae bacterium]|nr:bifunctional nuclease family protein [Saprospiraceae bacterium]
MKKKIELMVAALAPSESQPGNCTLVLEDFQQQRRIPITIGASEAQAIAMSMEKMQPLRPFTHDLLKNAIESLGATVEEVLINELANEIFYAKIILKQTNGQRIELDARCSDAVALAVRFDAPIFSYDTLIEDAGILVANLAVRSKKGSLAEYGIEELEELLQKLIAKEDFESAARIRDYLRRRNLSE